MKDKFNVLIKGVGVFLLYILVPYILDLFLPSLTKSNSFELLYRFMFLFLMLIFFVLIYRKDLLNDLKAFKKDKKKVLLNALIFFGLMLVGIAVISLVVTSITGNASGTSYESSSVIDSLFQENKLLMIFYVFVISLFTEQIVFRKVFKDIINNKLFFVIFSGLIYGIFQIGYNISSVNDLLVLLPYTYIGIIVSASYSKTDNIFTPCFVYLLYDLFVLSAFTFNI